MLDVFLLMAGRIPAVVGVGSEFPGAAGILSVPQCRLKAKGNFMIPSQSPWHRFWDPEKANADTQKDLPLTTLKTNMTLENHHVQKEIHLQTVDPLSH